MPREATMTQGTRLVLLVCTVLAVTGAGRMGKAQAAAALVLETYGEIHPGLTPYQEVPVDTQLTLTGNAKLVFIHYFTCRMVTVVGGTLALSTKTYTVTDGTKEAETRVPCPRQVALVQAEGVSAGAMVRSGTGDSALRLSTQPAFVLVGPRADDFAAVRVASQDGTVTVEAPMEERRWQWPAGVTPLVADTAYALTLLPSRAGVAPITLSFMVASPAGPPPGHALSLIRVE
jgi:hypothetical protein